MRHQSSASSVPLLPASAASQCVNLGEGEWLAAEEYVGCGAVIEIAIRRLGDRWHLALEYPVVVIVQVVDVEPPLLKRHQCGFDWRYHLKGHDQLGMGESGGDLWRDRRFRAL